MIPSGGRGLSKSAIEALTLKIYVDSYPGTDTAKITAALIAARVAIAQGSGYAEVILSARPYFIAGLLSVGSDASGGATSGIILRGSGRAKVPRENNGTVLRWVGPATNGPVLLVTNAHSCKIMDFGIDANGLADFGFQIKAGPVNAANDCYVDIAVQNAVLHNFLIGDAEPSSNDVSGLTVRCNFQRSMETAATPGSIPHTINHVLLNAWESFGVLFTGCAVTGAKDIGVNGDGNYYPQSFITARGGTFSIEGGFTAGLGAADVRCIGTPGCPPASFTWYNPESQSRKAFEVDDTGAQTRQRSCAIYNGYHGNITDLAEDDSGSFLGIGHGGLILNGFRPKKSIRIDAAAFVEVDGLYFDDTGADFTGDEYFAAEGRYMLNGVRIDTSAPIALDAAKLPGIVAAWRAQGLAAGTIPAWNPYTGNVILANAGADRPDAVLDVRNGKTAVRFDASGGARKLSAALANLAGSFTVYAVVSLDDSAGAALFEASAGAVVNNGIHIARVGDAVYARRIDSVGGTIRDASLAVSNGKAVQVISATFTPAKTTIRVNGVAAAENLNAVTSIPVLTQLVVGQLFGAIYGNTGDVFELILCNEEHSARQIAYVEKRLERYYAAPMGSV